MAPHDPNHCDHGPTPSPGCCAHGHAAHGAADLDESTLDPGTRSLSDALRLSFRLLSVLMVAVLGLFLLTGLTQIEPGYRGVRLVLGRIDAAGERAVLGEGLRWSWPEPVGRIVKVYTGLRTLQIDDFWLHERPEEAAIELSKRPLSDRGLQPGLDGALMMGDRGLVHVRLKVHYRIATTRSGQRLALAAATGPAGEAPASSAGPPSAEAVLDFLMYVQDPAEAVRSAVCEAVIRVAATAGMEAVYPGGDAAQSSFSLAVKELAQQRLREMRTGLEIDEVLLPSRTPPLAARAVIDAVFSARQMSEGRINDAWKRYHQVLTDMAGAAWMPLVGDGAHPEAPGLIEHYSARREAGDAAAAAEALARIDAVLTTSGALGGRAARILDEARSYADTIRRQVESRANTFQALLEEYEKTPQLALQRRWAEARQEILGSRRVEKWELTPGQRVILRISQDPAIARTWQQEAAKAAPDKASPAGH